MRHFEHRLIAHRYDASRPRLHGTMIASFIAAIGFTGRWAKVLDVACGTGHSSQPLTRYADVVIGIDVSNEMIEIARSRVRGVEFIEGSAETLPHGIGRVDAVFVANGFHWLQKDAFRESIRSVLSPGGWLVVYGVGSPRTMKDNPDYERWYVDAYWKKYPKPRTMPGSFADFVQQSGGLFGHPSEVASEMLVDLSPAELCAMITTQSNVHQALAAGEPIETVDAYLKAAVPGFFRTEKETFVFSDRVQYAQRVAP